MLTLVTGTPGAGKTSNTLYQFLEIHDRPRFATYINGFDYEKHDVGFLQNLNEWQSLPDNSVILVDEAQQYMRPRNPKDKLPEWIAAFETHRHRGFDFFFTTQHPKLIDIHVRRLVQKHIHYHRPHNLKTVSRLVWEECKEDPRDRRAISLASKERVKLPPSVFNEYTSTVIDTHKPEVPKKLVFMLLFLFIILGLCGYQIVKLMNAKKTDSSSSGLLSSPVFSQTSQQPVQQNYGHTQLSAADFKPVSELAPYTAPVYQGLAAPRTFPRFSGCLATPTKCTCYTQQGTRLDVSLDVCRDVVDNNNRPFDPHHEDNGAYSSLNGGLGSNTVKPNQQLNLTMPDIRP